MSADEPPGGEVRQASDPGSLADVFRAIESLRGRSLEEEIAGLRNAREKLLAAVPEAAERARLAQRESEAAPNGRRGAPTSDARVCHASRLKEQVTMWEKIRSAWSSASRNSKLGIIGGVIALGIAGNALSSEGPGVRTAGPSITEATTTTVLGPETSTTQTPTTTLEPTTTTRESTTTTAVPSTTLPPTTTTSSPQAVATPSTQASTTSQAVTTTQPAPATTTTKATPNNPGDSKNCGDFATQREAQAWFDKYYPYYGDVARLDADDDGIVCESLP